MTDGLKTVMPEVSAQALRENAPSVEGATHAELINWLERIRYAKWCNRQGLYMNVLTIPPGISDAVSAELRRRGFFVSSVLDGEVRYNSSGSAFVVRWVYVDWRHGDSAPLSGDVESLGQKLP